MGAPEKDVVFEGAKGLAPEKRPAVVRLAARIYLRADPMQDPMQDHAEMAGFEYPANPARCRMLTEQPADGFREVREFSRRSRDFRNN